MLKTPLIAVAPDSFKGAISAAGVANAIADGMKRAIPGAKFRLIPMADGGEGSVDAWADATGADRITVRVSDPLGRPVNATYAFLRHDETALIEMSAASGLPLLAPEERDPLSASTYGTGELIIDALDRGAKRIIMCIGGSATNDGGTGMATALGARFLNKVGNQLPPGGAALASLDSIDISKLDNRIRFAKFLVACDVTNPLCGSNGASAVYGPQKGATPDNVRILDAALGHLADIVVRDIGAKATDAEAPGAGAAGGMGFGLAVFCNASLERGFNLIAKTVGLREKLCGCDLVVTGEGRMDSQTANGKTPAGVATVAASLGIPVIAICGCVGNGYTAVHDIGINAVIPVAHGYFDSKNPAAGAVERITACAYETGLLLALQV